MQTKISPFFIKEKGASLVEYAILIALIAIVSYAVIAVLGQSINTVFSTANSSWAAASG